MQMVVLVFLQQKQRNLRAHFNHLQRNRLEKAMSSQAGTMIRERRKKLILAEIKCQLITWCSMLDGELRPTKLNLI